MSWFSQEYDIEVAENYYIPDLKGARKLVVNHGEITNTLEFKKSLIGSKLFNISVADIEDVIIRENYRYSVEIVFREQNVIGPRQRLSVLFKVDKKYLDNIREHLQSLRSAVTNKAIQRQIKSQMNPALCIVCFAKEYENVILSQIM